MKEKGKEKMEYEGCLLRAWDCRLKIPLATPQKQNSVQCSLKCTFEAQVESPYREITSTELFTAGPGSFDLNDSQRTSAYLTFFLSLSSVAGTPPIPHL